MIYDLATVMKIYEGSNGDDTIRMYRELEPHGAAGHIAVNVFRATKSSARAKVYRGGGYRGVAYERKQWAVGNLCKALQKHAEALGLAWGWGIDSSRTGDDPFKHVLYVELPTGQVSFHMRERGVGPDYAGKWDGVLREGPTRICLHVSRLLEPGDAPAATIGEVLWAG